MNNNQVNPTGQVNNVNVETNTNNQQVNNVQPIQQPQNVASNVNLRKENNDFLLNNLGPSTKENLSGLVYEYPWGKVMSYFDIKSAEAGIVICYY